MYAQLSSNYRLVGKSLYKREGNSFIHVAIIPSRIKGLARAVAWYESWA